LYGCLAKIHWHAASGFFFICFLSILALAGHHPDLSEPLNKVKEFQSDLVHHGQRPATGQLELLDEVLLLNSSHSQAKVEDLSVINDLKRRDIFWNDPQSDGLARNPLTNLWTYG